MNPSRLESYRELSKRTNNEVRSPGRQRRWWQRLLGFPAPQPVSAARRPSAVRLALDQLEDRTAPAVTLIYGGAGTVLSLTDSASGATPNITISEVAANMLQINLNGNTFAAGSTAAAGGLTYSAAGTPTSSTSATVNITAANQISTLLASLPGDFLSLGPINNANGGVSNLNLAANFIFVPAGATISTANASAATGNITLSAATIVQVNAGSSILANNGSITLEGNQGGTPTAGNFIAVNVNGGKVQTTGAGNILLQGTGSNDPTTGSHIGVVVNNNGATGGVVQASGTGSVTLDGTGGQGTGGNFGVDIAGAHTVVESATRPITITGQGGPGVSSTSFDVGVQLTGGAQILATGPATVSITGTGGQGTGSDFGVNIAGANTLVSSASTMQITGTGGGFGTSTVGIGVDIGNGAQVNATGALSLTGTGGPGTNADFGVVLDGTSGCLVTSATAVQITGTGGGVGAALNEIGVLIANGAHATATGTASLTITGTGGAGSGDFGVNIANPSTQVTAQGGPVQIDGSTNSAGGVAIQVTSSAVVSTTGSGTLTLNSAQGVILSASANLSTVDGGLTILANQGPLPAAGNFTGINVNAATVQTTGAGAIVLRGRGGADVGTGFHVGIDVNNAAHVRSTGSGSVTLEGTGGSGTFSNYGLAIEGAGSQVTSANGAIALRGTGGQGTAGFNEGVLVQLGGQVTAMGPAAITITGTAGSGTASNYGVDIEGTDSQVTSVNGAIVLTGTGGQGSADFNEGVLVQLGGQVTATGTAAISITGTGGTGTSNNYGISIAADGTKVSSVTGALRLTGTGGQGSGITNVGIFVSGGGQVQVSASGAGLIALTGTGGTGTVGADGVDLFGAEVTSQGGAIQVTGSADVTIGTSISIRNDTTVSTTGNGTLTVNATQDCLINNGCSLSTVDGALTILANQGAVATAGPFGGIVINGSTVQTTGAGAILLQGRGGNDPTTGSNIGILLTNFGATGGVIQATGTGRVTLIGTGGQGTTNNFGVELSGGSTAVESASGPIAITGQGGPSVTANSSDVGVQIDNGARVTAAGTGAIAITGTGGQGTTADIGVLISNGGQLTGFGTASIAITGTGGGAGTGSTETGVAIGSGGQVTAGGTIRITGMGGNGTGADFGVTLDGSGGGGLVQSASLVQITGKGGTSAAGDEVGVALGGGVQVTATGAAAITITGTGGGGSTFDYGVEIFGMNTIVQSATGTVTIAGTAGPGVDSIGVSVSSAAHVTATNALIILSGDSIALDTPAVISAMGNMVTLQPLTPSTRIDLGGTNGPGILGLSAAALNLITAGTLVVGTTTNLGGIIVSAPIAPAGASTLVLRSGSTVNQSAAGTGVTVATLSVNAARGIGTPANPLVFQVTTLSTDTTGGNGNQYLTTVSNLGNFQLNAGSGTIDLTGGRFLLTASDTVAASLLNVDNGALLGGTGTVGASVTIHSLGILSPGTASPGTVTIKGNLMVLAGATYFEKLNGTATGQFDQVIVSGEVALAGFLAGSVGFAPAIGDSFLILQNDGPNPVLGGFSGVPNSGFVLIDGISFQVFYTGGNGNDVVLVRMDPPLPPPPPAAQHLFAVGAGVAPEVKVYAADGTLRFDFFAYDPFFTGGVRVALADINGDGVPDVITAMGPGGTSEIKVFDGASGLLLRDFFAFGPWLTTGFYVAGGDLDHDGFADIVVGVDAGAAPEVKAFSGPNGAMLFDFFAYSPAFSGGVRVAVGDVNGDGFADIITGSGPGAPPEVKVFSGQGGVRLQDYFAFSPAFLGGIYVAAGDLNQDGNADVIVGLGFGGLPEVKAFDGASQAMLLDFFAYNPTGWISGVRVGEASLGGTAALLTAPGPGQPPEVRALDAATLAPLDDFFAFDALFRGGAFVGGS